MRTEGTSSAAAGADDYQLVTTTSHHKIHDDYEEIYSGHLGDPNTSLQAAFRRQYPELNLTVTSPYAGEAYPLILRYCKLM